MITKCPANGSFTCRPDDRKRRYREQERRMAENARKPFLTQDGITLENRRIQNLNFFTDGLGLPQCSPETVMACLRRHIASEPERGVVALAKIALEEYLGDTKAQANLGI